jgi:carbon storage regulator
MIGAHVKVTVMAVNGSQVRIGVDAPKDVAVHREEIYEKIKLEQAGPAADEPPRSRPPKSRFKPAA